MNKMVTQEFNTEILEAIMTVTFPNVKGGYSIQEEQRITSLIGNYIAQRCIFLNALWNS